jgi:hypothetical protein
MRPVERADRDLVCDDVAESLPRKPAVQVKRWRLDLERGLPQFLQIQINSMIWGRTDRGRNAAEHRQGCAMNVAGGDQLHPRMAPDNRLQFVGIAEMLAIHVPDSSLEWRMVQEQQRRPIRRRGQNRVEPLQGRRIELAVRIPGNAGIQQYQIEAAGFDLLIERSG